MHKNICVLLIIIAVTGTMATSRFSSCSVCKKCSACVILCMLSLGKTGYYCACLAIDLVPYFTQHACLCVSEREKESGRILVNCCKSIERLKQNKVVEHPHCL